MITEGFRFPIVFVCTRPAKPGEMVNGSELLNANNKFWARPEETDLPEVLCCSDCLYGETEMKERMELLDKYKPKS